MRRRVHRPVSIETESARRLLAARKAELMESVIADVGCTVEQFEKKWARFEAQVFDIETAYTRARAARLVREGVLILRDN